jgi:predicted methyltransferase MtxX (methanogen marker protein 4)
MAYRRHWGRVGSCTLSPLAITAGRRIHCKFRTPDIASMYHRDYLGSARLGLRSGADQYLSGFFGC